MKKFSLILKVVKSYKTHVQVFILSAFFVSTIFFYGCEEATMLNADDKDSTQSDPCKTNHTGNLFFKNSLPVSVTVNLDGGGFGSPSPIQIGSGQINGFLNIKSGSHSWDSRAGTDVSTARSGNVNIVDCKNDTITVK